MAESADDPELFWVDPRLRGILPIEEFHVPRRLRRALEEYVIGGIETTIPLHQRLVGTAEFIDGDYDIHWLERFVGRPG